MLLNEIWGLFDYWKDQPPTHIILSAVHGVKRKPDAEAASKTEAALQSVAGGTVQSFDNLPLAVQRAMKGG